MSEVPCNVDIERAVLGLVLLYPAMMDGLRQTLEPAEFVLPSHRLTWATCCQLYDAGTPPDLMLVVNDLMERAHLWVWRIVIISVFVVLCAQCSNRAEPSVTGCNWRCAK